MKPLPLSDQGDGLLLTDVSALSSHRVCRVVTPQSEQQVCSILEWARRNGKRICVAGAAHSMGSHTLADDALLIQTKFLARVTYDPPSQRVTAQTGALWADVIRILNWHGRTPRTLQSYCSFSVGGSIAANVHGITSDECLASSIVSLRMLLPDGRLLPDVRREGEHADLFRATVGGFGMTGVILAATFETDVNQSIETEVVSLTRESGEFLPIYQRLRADRSIVTKICRINVSHLDECTLYLFRARGADARQSLLPWIPNESMPLWKQLAYTLVFHRGVFQSLRYRIENWTQTPIDWANQPDRNTLLYETAAPLARLFSPAFPLRKTQPPGARVGSASLNRVSLHQGDTFLLKEYFVPELDGRFEQWWARMQQRVTEARPTLAAAGVNLLNITLRSVEQSSDSMLSYSPIIKARSSKAVALPSTHYVAVVFYWRLQRSESAENVLSALDRALIDDALDLDGTFYLPYRVSYTREQLLRAYPHLSEWLKLKRQLDPETRLCSEWYLRIVALVEGEEAAAELRKPLSPADVPVTSPPLIHNHSSVSHDALYTFCERTLQLMPHLVDGFTSDLDHLGGAVHARNSELVHRILTFLAEVLPVEPQPDRLRSAVVRATLRFRTAHGSKRKNECLDHAVYLALRDHWHGSVWRKLKSQWRALRILQKTRRQIGGEMRQLLSLLPDQGRSIRSVACIGDPGRYLSVLRSCLPNVRELHNIHDANSRIMRHIEAGSLLLPSVHTHNIDFDDVLASLHRNPSLRPKQRFSLITLAQGLHHLDSRNLDGMLRFVSARLEPGGYFLLREHDAPAGSVTQLMADVAHFLFNASTDVSWSLERAEVRNFQSCDTWRAIIASYGLEDLVLCNKQDSDSTDDFMMLFRKPTEEEQAGGESVLDGAQNESQLSVTRVAQHSPRSPSSSPSSRNPSDTLFMPCEWYVVDSVAHLRAFLSEQPWYRFPFGRELRNMRQLMLLSLRAGVHTDGWRATLSNGVFLSNLVACGFTSFFYLQMALFSALLRLVLGTEYASDNVMRVVCESPASGPSRIVETVPRYAAFSQWLNDAALRDASLRFVSINGESERSVLVCVDYYGAPSKAPLSGVSIVGGIGVPAFTSADRACNSTLYRVPIPQLADFLRHCATQREHIKGQPFVYDW